MVRIIRVILICWIGQWFMRIKHMVKTRINQ